ncbi:two-component sensor histidine kinase, partial [Streptomyces sp. NPDC004262]
MSGRRRPRAQQRRVGQPRTLRTRLVVVSVTLIAVVCAVIGTVTTLVLRDHLYGQLNSNLREVALRVAGGPVGGFGGRGDPPGGKAGTLAPQQTKGLGDFVTQGPQPQ